MDEVFHEAIPTATQRRNPQITPRRDRSASSSTADVTTTLIVSTMDTPVSTVDTPDSLSPPSP